ncbi:MAG: hypothetical protein K8L99_01655 [Anaerolineae bacterium]|nr:hypothetical protein [Anaerolineae bacterium]
MNFNDYDKYAEYEEQFDPMRYDRQARRKRKPKPVHMPKKSSMEVIEEVAETVGLEGGFQTTYQPGIFEEGWLLESLRTFYTQALIQDVLALVKGGKEANVYRCEGNPAVTDELIAAKVYRPRMFRNLRNDKLYREGRPILKSNGKAVKKTDHRLMRALGKKSSLGVQAAHTSWLMYEYTTLQKLHRAGAAVPKPLAVGDNTILMGYCGDRHEAAHTLNEIDLQPDEAQALFQEVMRNIELMLRLEVIHGDLSAYNILYWQGEITLIDFPQVTDPTVNPSAAVILERDITRVCQYFAEQGVTCDAQAIFHELWSRWGTNIELPSEE